MRKVSLPNCVKCGVVKDTIQIMMEYERSEAYRKKLGFEKHSIGTYNSILAFPLSDKAAILYKRVLGLKNKNLLLLFM